MSLNQEYPKTYRNLTARLRAMLEVVPGLSERERAAVATALNEMADKARDLDDIVQRLLNEPHTPEEIGRLLIAFELTTEQLRGHSDTVDGKLCEIGDRLSGDATSAVEEHRGPHSDPAASTDLPRSRRSRVKSILKAIKGRSPPRDAPAPEARVHRGRQVD